MNNDDQERIRLMGVEQRLKQAERERFLKAHPPHPIHSVNIPGDFLERAPFTAILDSAFRGGIDVREPFYVSLSEHWVTITGKVRSDMVEQQGENDDANPDEEDTGEVEAAGQDLEDPAVDGGAEEPEEQPA